MGLNELMKNHYRFIVLFFLVWSIAGSLLFYFLDIRFLKLSIIHNNLVDYIFVNNNETLAFFSPPIWSLQGSETLSEYSYFHAEVQEESVLLVLEHNGKNWLYHQGFDWSVIF